MEPLAGWTVAVTADRRSAEQIELLERRGATVLHVPTIQTEPLGPEEGLRVATAELVERPPDVLVATTAVGVRGWFASSWSWGAADDLHNALAANTEIVARGPKAAAAIIGEGLPVHWRAPGATTAEILEHLVGPGRVIRGRRVAVQLPGRRDAGFTAALQQAGAKVIELPVYQWVRPEPSASTDRLVELIAGGEVDAVTFTCAFAVTNLLALAGADRDRVIGRFGQEVTAACVGPVTAAAAYRSGLARVVTARPNRLGALVRTLADTLAAQALHLELDGKEVVVQGAALSIGGSEVRLTPRERTLFEHLHAAQGAVLSKGRLARAAWEGEVDDHAVEVAVNRLRRKLGPVATSLETSNRRGYRLALSTRGIGPRGTVHRTDLGA